MTGNTLYPVKKYTEETEPADINLNWPERYISIATGVKLTFSGLGGGFIFKPANQYLKIRCRWLFIKPRR